MRKRILAIIMTITMIMAVGLSYQKISRADEPEETLTGQCGDHATWTLTLPEGKMVISGTGNMWDFNSEWGGPDPTYFEHREEIKSIVIESGITGLGVQAFNQCTNLESIEIPDTVKDITSDWVLKDNLELTSIKVDENNPYFDSRNNCNAIIETETNTLIYGCKTTVIPDGIVAIGDNAFFGNSVEHIDFPASVETIGVDAFMWSRLTSVYIPKTVLKIGKGAFSATMAQTMEVHPDNPNYDSRNNCNAILRTRFDEIIAGCDYTEIPDTARIIGYQAMQGNHLEAIVVPENIEIIKGGAFQQSPNLRDITFLSPKISIELDTSNYTDYTWTPTPPKTTIHAYRNTSAEDYAKKNAIWFEALDGDGFYVASAYMGDDVYFTLNTDTGVLDVFGIGETWDFDDERNPWTAMKRQNQAKAIIIGEDITSVGNYSFAHLKNAAELALPETLERIGDFAFYENGIKKLNIPKNVNDIGERAFGRSSKLESIQVDAENTVFDSRNNCNAVMETGKDILRVGCKNTIIPEETFKIGVGAYEGAIGLTELVIPERLKRIDALGFAETGLKTVDIPESFKYLADGAFQDCKSLQTMKVYNRTLSTDMNSGKYVKAMPVETVIYGYKGCTMQKYASQTGNPFIPFPEPGQNEEITGKQGTDESEINKTILNLKNDKDMKGSRFNLLQLQEKKAKEKSIKIGWKKVKGAKKYVIYGNRCGLTRRYKKITSTRKTNYTHKKLKKGTYYKFLVVALDKNNKVITISKLTHITTKGGKYGNDKTVKLTPKKTKVTLKKGKKYKVKAKEVPQSKKKKVHRHRVVKYESDNTKVAKVSAKGVIKGIGKGKCYIYIYAQNGKCKKIKVTVK